MQKKLFTLLLTLLLITSSIVVINSKADTCSLNQQTTGILLKPMDVKKEIWNNGKWVNEILTDINEIIRFKITIFYHDTDGENIGGYKLINITITDKLPVGLNYSGNATRQPTYLSDDGRTISWNLTDAGIEIFDGENYSLEFDTKVTDSSKQIINVVNVSALERCVGIPRNEEATAQINVGPIVNIIKPEEKTLYWFNVKIRQLIINMTKIVGPITIKAEAMSNKGIDRVEFYIDGELKHTDSKPDFKGEYTWTWVFKSFNLKKNYTIKVIAYDKDGNSISDSIEVLRVSPLGLIGSLIIGSIVIGSIVLGTVVIGAIPLSPFLLLLLIIMKNRQKDTDEEVEDTTPIENSAPIIDMNDPYSGYVNTPVAFDASGSYDPENEQLKYSWDFGDGSTGSGEQLSHSYTEEGTYRLTLTVTDSSGKSSEKSTTVTITTPENNDTAKSDSDDGNLFWYVVGGLSIILFGLLAALYVRRKLYV